MGVGFKGRVSQFTLGRERALGETLELGGGLVKLMVKLSLRQTFTKDPSMPR